MPVVMAARHGEEILVLEPGEQAEQARAVPGGPAPKTSVADAPSADLVDEQALIEEARRRQRRRHRWIAAVFAPVVIGAGLGLGLSLGAGAPTKTAGHRPAHSSVPTSGSAPAVLNRPEALAVASDGELLISNQGTNQILRRTPRGTLTVVAGTGNAGYSGDGGQALKAELDEPSGMAVAADGTIYVADTLNNRVRAISPSGVIRTVAGNGHVGSRDAGGPAVDAEVGHPVAVALGGHDQLYIADAGGVQVVSPNGALTTVVAAGRALSIDGAAIAVTPNAIAVSSTGDLYVAEFPPKLLVELTPEGHVVASWPNLYVTAAGLASAGDGSVLVGDYGRFSVDRVTNGQIAPLVRFSLNSLAGLTGTFRPSGIAVSSTGQFYAATDGVNGGSDQPALAAISSSGQAAVLPTGSGANH